MALHLFYQSLPNKLDSLEKIQTWYYEDKRKINPCLLDAYLKFTKGSISILSGQKVVKGAFLSAIYSAKVNN